MALTPEQKPAFSRWRRMWRWFNGRERAELENAFAAGWLAGSASVVDRRPPRP